MRWLRATALVACASACTGSGTGASSASLPGDAAPRPTPSIAIDAGTSGEDAGASFEDCARCHAAVGRSHARSMHAAAAHDPLFQRELGLVRTRDFCLGCHASAGEAGVDCAACHVEDGVIVSAAVSGRAPHATAARPERSGDAACAGCHEFAFFGRPDAMLQRTLGEAASRHGIEGSCASCHMRDGDHAFAIDDAMLARAVDVRVEASRDGDEVVARFTLRAAEVGHAVPTGDLYRRLELRASIAGRPGSSRVVTFARSFRSEPVGLVETRDTRVPPPGRGARRTTLRLAGVRAGDSSGEVVRWELRLLAMPRERAEADALPPMLWERTVATGRVRVAR